MPRFIERLKQVARAGRDRIANARNRGYLRGATTVTGPLGLSAESMVLAYLQGLFPLGRPDGRIDWQTLDQRGVIPIDGVHVSKRLKTYLRKEEVEVRYNERFDQVLDGCAGREKTWINDSLGGVYRRLHADGVAHSVEAYQDGELVAGGFGLAIGRVFFLESMFTRVDHASKVAFVKLADRLRDRGFEWIDCQYLSEHWKRFGAKPMPRAELMRLTAQGLDCGARFGVSDKVAEQGRGPVEEGSEAVEEDELALVGG